MASNETTVAFCGLGIMGGPMAANLAKAGFELSVYTRTREKAEQFAAEHGARGRGDPARGRRGRVGGDHDGARRARGRGGAARRAGRRARARRGRARDRHVHDRPHRRARDRRAAGRRRRRPSSRRRSPAPGPRPRTARSRSWSAARQEAFERARPLFEAMGERIVHVGPQGHAQLAKLLTNTMGAVHAVALAESVLAAERAGLDPDAFLEVAAGSAGNSTVLGLKGRPMFDARLQAALQARAHAEGRAPLPRRGEGARRGAAPRLARGAALREGRGARATPRRTSPP